MNKNILEQELISNMQAELVKQAEDISVDNLDKAVDYLNSAIDIFENAGFNTQADQTLNVLLKIARKGKPKKPKDPRTVSDRHTKGLTAEKALENLKHHGTMFNMADVAHAEDLLNADIDFEDEE